jgi:putative ABC transport system substrate-binding protein
MKHAARIDRHETLRGSARIEGTLNRRRRRLVALGGVALAAPSALFGQTARRRIAWLAGARGSGSPFFDAFKSSLRDLGYEDGRNIDITAHFSDGTAGRTEELAREIIAAKPAIILSQGATVRTVHSLNPQLPVIFGFSGDPVEAGFVQSLARPGGNMTGMTFLSLDLVAKRIETLREVLPQLKRVAVLANPQHAGEKRERSASEQAARGLGLEVVYLPAVTAGEIEPALDAARQARCEAVDVYPDALMAGFAERIAAIALRQKMASVSGWSLFPDNGLLMSYGPNLRDVYRRIASYADKILRGARPADLPVELPTTVEMVVNLRTARALGLKVPPRLLVRADRVIE